MAITSSVMTIRHLDAFLYILPRSPAYPICIKRLQGRG
jgi:hypothetical protein